MAMQEIQMLVMMARQNPFLLQRLPVALNGDAVILTVGLCDASSFMA